MALTSLLAQISRRVGLAALKFVGSFEITVRKTFSSCCFRSIVETVVANRLIFKASSSRLGDNGGYKTLT
jgi:hypothetical protein